MRSRLAVAAFIALLTGAGLTRMWDHRRGAHTATPSRSPSPRRAVFDRTLSASRFARGNLHTHSNRSDGDAPPFEVARWYRDHGYAFVAITDHNVPSDLDLSRLETPGFVVLPGEEVSMYVAGRQVHVNALCAREGIAGGTFGTNADALEHAIGAVLAQGGVALVNHPNFDWALSADDVASEGGAALLEVASGHPYVHAKGDARHPSAEALWDAALTAGHDVMAVAVDDTHHLFTDADPEAFPGVAWVEVFGDLLGTTSLCDALRRGDLYASTGVTLRALRVHDASYEVEPAAQGAAVTFLGAQGRTLARVEPSGGVARYDARGDEGYVRARIEGPDGAAWTPAVRLTPAGSLSASGGGD